MASIVCSTDILYFYARSSLGVLDEFLWIMR